MSYGPQFRYYHSYTPVGTCPRCGAPQWHMPWSGAPAVQWPGEGYCYGPIRTSPEERYEAYLVSDQVLQDRVYDVLQADPRIPPEATVAVEARDRVVTLTGQVPDKWVKYLIGGDALSVPGVADVDNRVEIVRPRPRPASMA